MTRKEFLLDSLAVVSTMAFGSTDKGPALRSEHTAASREANHDLEDVVKRGWERVMRDYYWVPTSLIYTCFPKDVQKADFYTNGFRVWEKQGDYGYGLEDCAILGGVGLSGLCDAYAMTRDERYRRDAAKLARGLVNLGTVHGVKGFIARGICVEDGKSVCALSSIDQHTHCLHGLWRYWRSPILDPLLKPEIARVVSEVADRMTVQVTKENDWSFQQAVGHASTRGICKMRFNRPHEGARLAMFYAVAWDVTRKPDYRELWRKYLEEGLSNSLRLKTAIPAGRAEFERWMPNYTLLQMQSSLEVLYALAPSERERATILEIMRFAAGMAQSRALGNRSGNGRYLCSCGELALAQLMVPDGRFPDAQRSILEDAIAAESFDTVASSTRIVHLFAAYWRWRRDARLVANRQCHARVSRAHPSPVVRVSHAHTPPPWAHFAEMRNPLIFPIPRGCGFYGIILST